MLKIGEQVYSDVTGRTYTISWVSPEVANAEVGFASVAGHENEFFIKKLISVKYPVEATTEKKKRKQEKCNAFYAKYSELYHRVSNVCGTESSCVPIEDFFREGPFYYTVYRKITPTSLSIEEISSLSKDAKLQIVSEVIRCLLPLHSHSIVHGDLKPDNILIRKERGVWRMHLVDMNDCYESKKPNMPENVLSTPEYNSPELASYICNGSMYESDDLEFKTLQEALTTKSDIFALGIIFCEYFTGGKPIINKENIHYIHQAVSDNCLLLPDSLDCDVKEIISKMLLLSPNDRPSLYQLSEQIKKIRKADKTPKELIKPTFRYAKLDNNMIEVCIESMLETETYYTIDETLPDETKKKYTGPFNVPKFTILKAVSIDKTGRKTSVTYGQAYTSSSKGTIVKMTKRSNPPKVLAKGRKVSIKIADSSSIDTKIFYTTDGSRPNTNSQLYTGEFEVESGVKIVKAIALEPDDVLYTMQPSEIKEKKIWI